MMFTTSTISWLWRLLPGTDDSGLLILIDHRVRARQDPMYPDEVDAARFESQMKLLRRHCTLMSLSDGVNGLDSGGLPDRAVAVTFDGGYADNAAVALPILVRHGICATFFIATAYLDGGRMWNDTIIESIRRAPVSGLDLSDLDVQVANLQSFDDRRRVAEGVIRKMKHDAPDARQRRAESLRARVGVDLPRNLMMTSDQLRELAAAGMEIGAHTKSHAILRLLTEPDARMEIAGSREFLEGVLRVPVKSFAYPNGRRGDDYTEHDRSLVESLGFDYALSTQRGVASAGCDRFQLPRFTPWDRNPARWLARLLAAFAGW